MTILDGKVISEKMYNKMVPEVFKLRERGIYPHLAAVLVGNNPDSALYVSLKEKQAKKVGVDFSVFHIKDHEDDKEILDVLEYLNNDEHTHGIIVQLPLPEKFNTKKVLEKVAKEKDVDGLRSNSIYQPPSPLAIRRLLEYYKIDLYEQKIVIVGKGRLVGVPLEKIMKDEGFDVVTVDEKTKYLINIIKSADILIAATGSEGIITDDLVNEKMTVISVGREAKFEEIKDKVEAITPPIGGVGPLTIAYLLKNTVEAAHRLSEKL